MNKVYYHTFGLCPACHNLEKVPARVIRDNNRVYLEKSCPQHGVSRVMIAWDVNWYEASTGYVKPGQEPLKRNVTTFNGCPDSCGFCPQHRQHRCLPVIEITHLCQLDCPVCLKKLDRSASLPMSEFSGIMDELWSAADSSQLDEKILARIKNIWRTMSGGTLNVRQKILMGSDHLKAIFIHHFMDVVTMDWERLTKCCNPYPRTGDRLVPMCAENIFFQEKIK